MSISTRLGRALLAIAATAVVGFGFATVAESGRGPVTRACKYFCQPSECEPCVTLDQCGCCNKKIPGCRP